jgi:hypothetical protein
VLNCLELSQDLRESTIGAFIFWDLRSFVDVVNNC